MNTLQTSIKSVEQNIKRIRADVSNRQRALSKAVLGALQEPGGTPVITGRLRANWKVGLGAPNTTSDWENYDPSSQRTYNEGAAIIDRAVLGQDVFITNSLSYAGRIDFVENIRFPQNPMGMRRPVMDKILGGAGVFGAIFSGDVSGTVRGNAGPGAR